jgi:hypothetical protein
MTTANPYLLVALDAYVINARRVLDALGTGPAGLARALVDVDQPSPNHDEPAIAWCQFDQSGDSELVAKLNGLCSGALPAIAGYWGEDGVISSLDAQQAFMDEHCTVVSAINVPVDRLESTIAGALAGLGYKFRDFPEP